MKKYILGLGFILISLLFSMRCDVEPIGKISSSDKQSITDFFHYLMWDCRFAYTLFGQKPMSTIGYCDKFFLYTKCEVSFYHTLPVHWEVWKKYYHPLPDQQVLLIAKKNKDWLEIFLINRKACLEKIRDNLLLFQKILNAQSSPEEILYKIETSENLFRDGLNNSQALYGILLGYGEKNALGFEAFHAPSMFYVDDPIFFHGNDPHLPLRLNLPFFMIFAEETIHDLRSRYESEREKILEIYKGKDFLETTLHRLST